MSAALSKSRDAPALSAISKTRSGIDGLDEMTYGGLPRGRTTLVCGGPGCGKTLLALQFAVTGAIAGEPAVILTLEESGDELTENVSSLGWDLADLQARKLLAIDHIRVADLDLLETGEWDLEGLFVRLGVAIDGVGARRLVLDPIEVLFSALRDRRRLRSELRRLFRWLQDRDVTTVVTAEQGDGAMTRHGLEEYVSDCVIALDHRVRDQISTRLLRIVKYRGSLHTRNECPFLIDRSGISVMPVSSLGLDHEASIERVSTGVDELDRMIEGGGYYRGSSVLLSGTSGSGKTTVACRFLEAGCERGECGELFTFEESPAQIIRNMRSAGINLASWIDAGLLRIVATRPATHGLESHLVRIEHQVDEFEPLNVVIDPLSSLEGAEYEVKAMLGRLIDHFKRKGMTAFMTTLTMRRSIEEPTAVGISSVIDTWLDLSVLERDGERNRAINVLKSRGMAHSNQVREFLITRHGLEIGDVYVGERGVLMGSARRAEEARELAQASAARAELEAKRRRLEYQRSALEAQIAEIDLAGRELANEVAVDAQPAREPPKDGKPGRSGRVSVEQLKPVKPERVD